MDVFTPAKRSEVMSRIRGRDTTPELAVRRFLHRSGFRFRLHADLPGRPDIVLPRWRTAILVHGCFWHRHAGCRLATTPSTNCEFWTRKFEQNTARDRRTTRALRRAGWKVIVVWQCEIGGGCLARLPALVRKGPRPQPRE